MPLRSLPLALLAFLASVSFPRASAARPLSPEDWYRFRDVSDLQISPDGGSVAYLVTSWERGADESRSVLWSVDWGGSRGVPLTRDASASEPRFSPDGRYLSFLVARPHEDAQLWLRERRGGAAHQLSHLKGEIVGYAWSPDSRRLVLAVRAGHPPGKPIVIDDLEFKLDGLGYLNTDTNSHLFLLDARSGALEPLTTEPRSDDRLPAWSPDGRQIVYASNHRQEPEAGGMDEIYLIEPHAGATPRRLVSVWSPNRQHLEWSPDGKLIALLQGFEPRYAQYITDRLAVVTVPGGELHTLTDRLDRAAFSPRFTADGRAIRFAVEDDGQQYLAQVRLASGAIERLEAGPGVVHQLACAAGRTAALVSSDRAPVEVHAFEPGGWRALSAHNRALLSELSLGAVEDIAFRSADGTEIHGQVVKPPGYEPGRRYPTIVWIHGGPEGQDDHSLQLEAYGPPLERQLFAIHGYLVLAINYRGSTGRGAQFARTIAGDWGHREVEDLLAGTDAAIARGLADPARLGIGGWSYGGILTDYVIASDSRFKAAISGGGSGDQIAMYGSDEYTLAYNAELDPPWRNPEAWIRISYPFFHADRIRTPTLFLGGDQDSTSRSPAVSRCTRRCAPSACRPSSSSIRASITSPTGRAFSSTATGAISSGWANTSGSHAEAARRPRSPAVTQLAQLQEHGARVGALADVRERLPEPCDDLGILQAEEGVDALLLAESGHLRRGRVMPARLGEQPNGVLIAGLAVERELEVARQVLVARVYARLIRQPRELRNEGLVQPLRMSAVVAVAGAGVEEGVAAEQRRPVRVREQADMRERVAGGVEAFELGAAADPDDVALGEAAIHAADARGGGGVRRDLRPGGRLEAGVAAGVVAVLVGVEDLRDLPAAFARRIKTQLPLERIDRERLAGLRAGDEIVEVAQGVSRPDPLGQHHAGVLLAVASAHRTPNVRRAP